MRFSRCPIAAIGGGGGVPPAPGPRAEPWLGRLFRVARLAKMGIQPADLSASGVDALCTLDAERGKVEREHIERARRG